MTAKTLLILAFTCLLPCVCAQEFGILGSLNGNFTSTHLKSSKANSYQQLVLPSWTVGGFMNKSLTEKGSYLALLELSNLRNLMGGQLSIDEGGNPTGELEIISSSIFLNTSILYTRHTESKFYYGAGLTAGVMLISATGLVSEQYTIKETSFFSTLYSPFSLSVPLLIGLDFNAIDLFLKFNIGITDRMRGDNLIKQHDHTLNLGLSYTFTSNK